MSQLISVASSYEETEFDTKIPSLGDTANIVEAFKLYHYGLDNYNGDVSPASDSIHGHFASLDSRVSSLEVNPTVSISGTVNEVTVSGGSGTFIVGLPDDVTITDLLTVTGSGIFLSGIDVTGPADISGNVIIGGNLTVGGSTSYVNTQSLTVTDPLLYIGEDNQANVVDLGLVASYNDGSYQHTGLVRDATDGVWKLFYNVEDEPTTTINFAQAEYDQLKLGSLEAVDSITTSGLTATGNIDLRLTLSSQSASYTLDLSDVGKVVEMLNASANTLTVPPNSSTPFPIGTQITILQTGSGQTTLTPGSGVTVNATPGLKLRAQWSSTTLIKRDTDTWVAIGDLVA